MRSLFIGFIIFLTATLFISCSSPKELVYKDFQNLTVEKLGFNSSLVKMDLIYYNPNNFGLQLRSMQLDVFMDSTLIGHTSQDYQISIPKRADFSIPIAIDVDMKNILKNSLTSLLHKKAWIRIDGTVKVGKLNVYKNFPVHYAGWQDLDFF